MGSYCITVAAVFNRHAISKDIIIGMAVEDRRHNPTKIP